MKKNLIAAAALAAALPAAHAVDIKAGDWTVSVGGNINAFYTTNNCKNNPGTVGGLALADASIACNNLSAALGGTATQTKSTTIGNGLLPSQIALGARSKQSGYDIAANITISVSTATENGIGQNNVVDVRNAFMTIGNASIGTFKLGRDYGLFGLNAVLNDMTLLGVGSTTKAFQNGRVGVGHLGAGMLYAQHYGQFVWSAPSTSGIGFDIGVMSPVSASFAGLADYNNPSSSPQMQARLTFGSGPFKGWVAAKNQKFEKTGANPGFTMDGAEIGGAFNSGALGLVANYQSGKALGILNDGDQGAGSKTEHTFVQGTYKVAPSTKLGVGYGKSENKNNSALSGGLKSNESTTFGIFHNITPQVTLVGEVGNMKSKGFNNKEAKVNSVSFGAIFFF